MKSNKVMYHSIVGTGLEIELPSGYNLKNQANFDAFSINLLSNEAKKVGFLFNSISQEGPALTEHKIISSGAKIVAIWKFSSELDVSPLYLTEDSFMPNTLNYNFLCSVGTDSTYIHISGGVALEKPLEYAPELVHILSSIRKKK